MAGGVAVRRNLLCVTWSAGRGHVFLFDLEAGRRMSTWTMPAGEGGYSDAAGVAMDEHFHLFVADPHNDRVRHFSAFGRHLGDLGVPAPAGGDAPRDKPGVLHRPQSVALHGDTVFVGMGDRPRRRGVQRFARNGPALRPLASGGDVEATFGAPRALWAGPEGILVADTLAGRIQRFRPDGTFVSHLPCAAAGALARPIAVLRLPGGHVLIADSGDRPGVAVLRPEGAPVAPDPAAMEEHCREPVALCADEAGRIYVLDLGGERVQRFRKDLSFDQVLVDLREHLDDYPAESP
jgi:hypothetical protein